MVLGTFPTKAGIPSRCTNLEMFTSKMWKHDAASVSQCQRVSVCGQRRPSALVTRAGGRRRGWGRYYQALISVAMMTSRHTHTHIRHTCTSISSGLSLPPLAPLPLSLTYKQTHTPKHRHTHQSLKITA